MRYDIIHIDDDADDLEFLREAVAEHHPELNIMQFQGALPALTWLEGLSADELPRVVITDINMPILRGEDFLRRLDCNDRLGRIPKIILSNAKKELAIKDCPPGAVELFLEKPTRVHEYAELVRQVVTVMKTGKA